jgi:hypothetical protein
MRGAHNGCSAAYGDHHAPDRIRQARRNLELIPARTDPVQQSGAHTVLHQPPHVHARHLEVARQAGERDRDRARRREPVVVRAGQHDAHQDRAARASLVEQPDVRNMFDVVEAGDMAPAEMAHETRHESGSIQRCQRIRIVRQDLGRRREEVHAALSMPGEQRLRRHQPAQSNVLFARRRHEMAELAHDPEHRLGATRAADLSFDAQLAQPARGQP